MTMANDNHTDILSRLDAMRVQEATTNNCLNYFKVNAGGEINEACRKAMVTWIKQVQTTLELSPETVWMALSFFDRYLSSNKSVDVFQSKRKFQLAAITAFYTAVKIYEPVVLGIDMLIQICRGAYTQDDIVSMENDILAALDWRVSCHTPMDFARNLLELVSDEEVALRVSDNLLESCQKHLDFAITDISFSCFKPSILGTSCLATSLMDSDLLSFSEKQSIWVRLTELCNFDLSSSEAVAIQQCFLSHAHPTKSNTVSKLGSKSRHSSMVSAYLTEGVSSSPKCVTQIARQA